MPGINTRGQERKNQQIRNKCRMTPVYICVKTDLRKENDAHDNISKLSPTKESK